MLPQLLLKQKEAVKSQTTMYFGFKGIRTAHEHIYDKLKRGECYYYLGVPAYQPKEQHIYWQKDHQRSIEAGIKRKLLFNKDTSDEITKTTLISDLKVGVFIVWFLELKTAH